MVHRRVKQSSGQRSIGSHNRAWIWGRHVVLETLRAGRWPVQQLVLSLRLDAATRDELLSLARDRKIPVLEMDDPGVTSQCRSGDHQGCAAKMGKFPYLGGEEFLRSLPPQAIILILDRIQDPYNLGTILRTIDGLGLDGVLIGGSSQVGVNSLVARSSAGAVNHVPIGQVDDLAEWVSILRQSGWQVWAASEKSSLSLNTVSWQPPLALVIGNEGHGIAAELLAGCSGTVAIPMQGHVGSLNAAVSAGILSYQVAQACRPHIPGT